MEQYQAEDRPELVRHVRRHHLERDRQHGLEDEHDKNQDADGAEQEEIIALTTEFSWRTRRQLVKPAGLFPPQIMAEQASDIVGGRGGCRGRRGIAGRLAAAINAW